MNDWIDDLSPRTGLLLCVLSAVVVVAGLLAVFLP